MSQGVYIAIAVGIIVILTVFVFISFVVLRRMPAPKGCEDIKTNAEKCGACREVGCPIYGKYHKEEE